MAEQLAEHHRAEVVAFMRLAAGKRQLRMRSVGACFSAVCEGRLSLDEESYTAEEVRELVSGLRAAVLGELELELLHSSHMSALLLVQLFQQAERWRLRMRADLSELENRQLLEGVAEMEQGAGTSAATAKPRLQPIGDPAQLLNEEIARLQEENDKLRARLRALEGHVTAALDDKTAAQRQLQQLKEEAPPLRDDSQMDDALAKMKLDFQKSLEERDAAKRSLEDDLTGAQRQLLRTQEELGAAQRELDRKFQETTAYRNMKDMLGRKNEQIRQLRHALAKYEPDT
ncbi:leucine zipper transcription factor-like protein 1 [Gastrophryne carolinensis]